MTFIYIDLPCMHIHMSFNNYSRIKSYLKFSSPSRNVFSFSQLPVDLAKVPYCEMELQVISIFSYFTDSFICVRCNLLCLNLQADMLWHRRLFSPALVFKIFNFYSQVKGRLPGHKSAERLSNSGEMWEYGASSGRHQRCFSCYILLYAYL